MAFGKIIKRERIPDTICTPLTKRKKLAPVCFRYTIKDSRNGDIVILPSLYVFPEGEEIEYNQKKIITTPNTRSKYKKGPKTLNR